MQYNTKGQPVVRGYLKIKAPDFTAIIKTPTVEPKRQESGTRFAGRRMLTAEIVYPNTGDLVMFDWDYVKRTPVQSNLTYDSWEKDDS